MAVKIALRLRARSPGGEQVEEVDDAHHTVLIEIFGAASRSWPR